MKFILDAGHGGLINGVYQTKGKRSYFESLGHFYEGVYNREIVLKLSIICDYHGVDYHILVPEQKDVKLSERIKREHSIHEKGDVLISVHCDAFSKESANGFSTFSYNHVNNVSKQLNKEYYDSNGCQLRNRGTRTANFYMLRKSKSKAVLIECGFMTNYNDVCYLKDEQDNIVEGIFNFMVNYKTPH